MVVLFLRKKYDTAYTLVSEALIGLPLVERLDDASAEAMWSANINVTQHQTIKKHLCFFLGSACSFLSSRLVMIVRIIMSLHYMVKISITRKVISLRSQSDFPIGAIKK
jgi:hypothetical protein